MVKSRFFKAYFISSLIYAIVFGLLMYGVGLLLTGFECFDIDAEMNSVYSIVHELMKCRLLRKRL